MAGHARVAHTQPRLALPHSGIGAPTTPPVTVTTAMIRVPVESKLTLTMSGNGEVRDDVQRYLRAAHAA